MLTKSQRLISHVTKNIIQKVQTQINSLEYANNNKGLYSSHRILGVLQQIADQISSLPASSSQIPPPISNRNLKMDNHMSVFNVQVRQIAVRHRSFTKTHRTRTLNSSREENNKLSIARKPTPYNKIKELNEQDFPKNKYQQFQQQKESEGIQDTFRIQLQKKDHIIQQKRKTKIKFLTPIQQKQKFSYDYECQRIKVKSQLISNLIKKDKSLVGQLSKKIQKFDLPHKAKKPELCQTQVSKIIQKVKKEKQKRRKIIQQQQKAPQQPIVVQFSDIKSLTEEFQCQQGVKFIFEGGIFKKRAKNNLSIRNISKNNHLNNSKVQIQLQKKRSYSSMSDHFQKLQKNSQQQIIKSQRTKNLFNKQILSRHRKSKSTISIANESLLQTFLAPEHNMTIQTQHQKHRENSQVSSRTNKSLNNLSKIDQHNIMYLKKAFKDRKTKAMSKQQFNIIFPHHSIVKIPYIRAREKLQNRKSTLFQMKKRFEESLRVQTQT